MHTSKLIKCSTSVVIFHYHLFRWVKSQIHTIDRLSDLSVGRCIHTGYKQEGLHRELKMTHIDFGILNSHVTIIYHIYSSERQGWA